MILQKAPYPWTLSFLFIFFLKTGFADEKAIFQAPDLPSLNQKCFALFPPNSAHDVDVHIERMGKGEIRMDSFLLVETDLALFKDVIDDSAHYERWLIAGPKQRWDGAMYKLEPIALVHRSKSDITLQYKLHLGPFQRPMERTFRLQDHHRSSVVEMHAVALPNAQSIVEALEGNLIGFSHPARRGFLCVYIGGILKIRSALLAGLLPRSLLSHESLSRLQQIRTNYEREELLHGTPPQKVPVVF